MENRKQGVCQGDVQTGRERGKSQTLFLPNRAGVLKVRVTVTSFPVVSAPPATGRAPRSFPQVRGSEVQQVMEVTGKLGSGLILLLPE